MRVAVTGGIGSGKSTVSRLLAEHGAHMVDADALAREVVQPGSPGLAAVAERFGTGVLRPDGSLDRAALAARVFGDDDALAALNAIVHPLVQQLAAARLGAVPAGEVAVYDVPLLAEVAAGRGPFDVVVVVQADPETRVARLVGARGMSETDARARIASQADDARRAALADVVVPNDGDEAALRAVVDALWVDLQAQAAAAG